MQAVALVIIHLLAAVMAPIMDRTSSYSAQPPSSSPDGLPCMLHTTTMCIAWKNSTVSRHDKQKHHYGISKHDLAHEERDSEDLTDHESGKISHKYNANVFDFLTPTQRAAVSSCKPGFDVTGQIRAAVRAAYSKAAGHVVLPDGCYRTSGTISLPSNIELVGSSIRGTRIMPGGNYPAISALGNYAGGLSGIGVRNMSIICAGMANRDAMGVKLVYVNRGVLKDLYFNGCYHALDLYDQWQTAIDNVTVDGLGNEQNYIGMYMGAPTDITNKMPNNAVVMSNSTMQNVAKYGYNLVYFAGSKFVNNEAMNGETGWKLCGEAYIIKKQPCQFGHFSNIISDSTRKTSIVVSKGDNGNDVDNIMFDNVWVGSSNICGFDLDHVSFSEFNNLHITVADCGLSLKDSHNVEIHANISSYNKNNDKSYAVVIDGGRENTIFAGDNKSLYPVGYNGIIETNSSGENYIWGGLADCTPGLAFGGGSTGVVYKTRSCKYEVRGRQVRLTFQLTLAALGSSSGDAVLTGLPMMADQGAFNFGAVGQVIANSMLNVDRGIVVQVVPGAYSAGFYTQTFEGIKKLDNRNFSTSSTVTGNLEYIKN